MINVEWHACLRSMIVLNFGEVGSWVYQLVW